MQKAYIALAAVMCVLPGIAFAKLPKTDPRLPCMTLKQTEQYVKHLTAKVEDGVQLHFEGEQAQKILAALNALPPASDLAGQHIFFAMSPTHATALIFVVDHDKACTYTTLGAGIAVKLLKSVLLPEEKPLPSGENAM